MKKLILCILITFVALSLFSQYPTDSILVKKRLGTVFQQNGKNLTPRQLITITQLNQEAYTEMRIAKRNYDFGYILGFAGGFMVGWPIGTSLGGGDPNWALAAIGAGLIVVSIPFSSAYSKHAKNAVRIYNNSLKTSYLLKPEFRIDLTYSGIGLKCTF